MLIENYDPNVELLEAQVKALEMKLQDKMTALYQLEVEEDELITKVNSNVDAIPGIGIR